MKELEDLKTEKETLDKSIDAIEKINNNFMTLFNTTMDSFKKREKKRDKTIKYISIALIISLLLNIGLAIYTIYTINQYNTIEEVYEIEENKEENYDINQSASENSENYNAINGEISINKESD